ncbi:hypothetical protein [Acinetobacter indicus]|uniref:hypothetical protein n=1 Tax=Acinetobacter indicus TaxID=756892 RepID=UPI000CECD143|nr:hypothetical protein [Acinetobacter indicus]
MSLVVSKTDVLDDLIANAERFSWLATILGQIRKELKTGTPAALQDARKLTEIAHYLSDDYHTVLDLQREQLEAEMIIGEQQRV